MKYFLLLSLQLSLTNVIAQDYFINENFNASTLPNGWTNNAVSGTQVWSFGINGSTTHAGNQNLNGTSMAYFDDDNLGSSSLNNTVELTTPTFDNTAAPYSYLSFQYNFREYNQANDAFYVDVYDGSQWQRVFTRTIDDCGNYVSALCNNNFPTAFIDITSYANSNCQVRFTYHDGNDWGWYVGVDDVKIWSPHANDLAVDAIIAPESNCGLKANDSIKVLISNQGYLTQQNFNIAYILDGAPLVVENIPDSIAYQDSMIYTFSTTGNFASFGMHDLEVFTQLSNDSSLTNDTLVSQISNDSIYQPPYFNDFENVNNGWSTAGTQSSWQRGMPQTANLNSVISGQNAWVTDLNGTYNSNEQSYLISPCFDFSNESGDPIISFYLNYQTELNYDGFWLESSIDGGQSWQKVNATNFATNWYSNLSQQVWDGNSNSWVLSTNTLSNLAGEPQVKLRFVFDSDPSVNLEGIAIDDINIIPRQDFDLSLEKINYPDSSSICGYGNSNRINLALKNFGRNPIDSFQVFYQLDSLPLDSEWVFLTIDTLTTSSYTSQQTFNFSQLKPYTLKVWLKVLGDTNSFNDTLVKTFTNTISASALSIPFSENFDAFNQGAANQNGWSTNPVSMSLSSFGWRAISGATSSSGTGPVGDHTSGSGSYIYLETSSMGTDGTFESPCINFNHPNGAILSFWYHRYGTTMQDLEVDYYDGQAWINVKTISQQPQTSTSSPWTYEEVFLPLSGVTSKFRFRGSSASCCSGDVAIDDVNIEAANLNLINLSQSYVCDVSNKLAIDLMLINKSVFNVSPGNIKFTYTINGQQSTHDTLYQSLGINDTINFTFSDSININQLIGTNTIAVKAEHINPMISLEDSLSFDFIQPFLNENFQEDFEALSHSIPNSTLWSFNGNWLILNDTINNNTTIKNKTYQGVQYLYSSKNGLHDVSFESNCINSREADSLDLVFWYNVQGTSTSKLYILDKSDSNELIIDSIVGSSPSNQWQRKQLSIDAYLDSTFILAFRFLDTNLNQNTAVSIDDIQLYEQKSPYDVRVNDYQLSLNNCNYSAKTISISLENLGLDTIPAQAIEVNYQIDQNTAVQDTVQQAIAEGETYLHEFSTPANFSQIGNTYNLRLWSKLNGDFITENDTLITSYTNQTKVDSLYEDFETFTDFTCISNYRDELKNGWQSPNNTWGVHDAASCSPYPLSGPSYDHTSTNGKFIYVEPTNNLNKKAELYSPCIDLSNVNNPVLSYWYHLYGSNIDTFKVEVNLNGQWLTIDSLIGQQQTFAAAAWRHSSIQLNNYKYASPLQFRFSSQIKGRFNRLALDDISIADSLVTSLTQSKADGLNYRLYPNPSQGQFTLEVDQSFVGEIFQVRELSGKVVQEGKVHSHSTTIQLNEVAKGIYFLSIPTKNVQEKVVVY